MTELSANPATYSAVLKSAAGGDVITLAAGRYPATKLSKVAKEGVVTVTGAGAVLEGLTLTTCSGFRFTRLEFDLGVGKGYRIALQGAFDIHFDGCDFHGPAGAAAKDKTALPSAISMLGGCSNISVVDNLFTDLDRACGGGGTGIVVARNKISGIRTDGMIWAEAVGIEITDNEMSDFYPAGGAHPDGIQFMTTGTKTASSDILIARNSIQRGAGAAAQGIFLGDEVGTLPFRRVKILDNLLIGTGYQGIAVGHGEEVEIARNELLSLEGKTNKTWILARNVAGLKITDNAAIAITVEPTSTAVENSGNELNQPLVAGKAGAEQFAAWSARVKAPEQPQDPAAAQIASLTERLTEARAELASAQRTVAALQDQVSNLTDERDEAKRAEANAQVMIEEIGKAALRAATMAGVSA